LLSRRTQRTVVERIRRVFEEVCERPFTRLLLS